MNIVALKKIASNNSVQSTENKGYSDYGYEDEPWFSKLSRKAWGGIGGAAGAVLALSDKVTGNSQGSWKDYIRTGYNIGHDNADMMAAGMAEGMANAIPFYKRPGRYMSDIADQIYAYNDGSNYRLQEDYLKDRTRLFTNTAGSIATWPAYMKGFSLLGKTLQGTANVLPKSKAVNFLANNADKGMNTYFGVGIGFDIVREWLAAQRNAFDKDELSKYE